MTRSSDKDQKTFYSTLLKIDLVPDLAMKILQLFLSTRIMHSYCTAGIQFRMTKFNMYEGSDSEDEPNNGVGMK